MYKRHETGKTGEDLACAFLEEKQYQIIQRNFRCKMGEIDIIAKEREEIVFVEVKTRGQKRYGLPAEAVNKRKRAHIYLAAEYFLMLNQMEKAFCRIDIIEIFISAKGVRIHHIKNGMKERPSFKKARY